MATLYDQAQAYLNQGLPSISGIFGPTTPTTTTPVVEDTTTNPVTGLTPEQLALLYPQNQGGGGGDNNLGGGGAFGNLDLSTAKEFNIDGDIVTGYKNLNTGLYQDFAGKNIQNLGLRNLPGITGLFEKMFGKGEEPTYPGLFDKVSPSALFKNPYMAKSFFDRQDVAKQKAIQDEIDAANKQAAQDAQVARARAANTAVYESADRQGFTNDRGGFSTSAADRAGTSAGSGQFSPSTSRGRSGY